jgi:uncharacterized protein YegP (UPF0339 family)
MSNSKFKIFRDVRGEYRFRLIAGGNYEPILASEGYVNKQGCNNGIASVRTNAPFDARYDRKSSVNNKFYFVLKAGNGETIGTSEMYETAVNRDHGIEAVKIYAPGAIIEDLS